MAKEEKAGLNLHWRVLLLAIPALAGFHFSDQLLHAFGAPANIRPLLAPGFNGHLESAGRLGMLSSLVLLIGVSAAALAALAVQLRTLGYASRVRIGIGILALTAAAVATLASFPTRTIPDDIGHDLYCAAAGQPTLVHKDWIKRPATGPDRIVAGAAWNEARRCTAPSFIQMLRILEAWKWVFLAGTIAVVFGTICCLAAPPPQRPIRARADNLLLQAGRLHVFLYISAALMVSALLVQAAFIRWPRFALADQASFDAHVNAIIFYYGVSYSVFLATFYVPVAVWLHASAEKLGAADVKDELVKRAKAGPAAIAKVAATVLAPALAALLSAFVELP